MPHWLMNPKDGGEPHVATTRRGKRPADEGYDESLFEVERLRRAMSHVERVVDGQVRKCSRLTADHERQSRIAEIGFEGWIAERVAELVAQELASLAGSAGD